MGHEPMTLDLASNVLYNGNNLDILRRYLLHAYVDLVYLDPPFNSRRDDNVIFRDESGCRSDDDSGRASPANKLIGADQRRDRADHDDRQRHLV